MNRRNILPNDPEWAHLVRLEAEKIRNSFPRNPDRWILVDTALQRLTLHRGRGELVEWPVSTARVGLLGKMDSNGTPPGLHIIQKKIGSEAPAGMIFESREPTGVIWDSESAVNDKGGIHPEQDLILTRILTLEGLEEGLNRGPGCDSMERYIYIHGTNHEDQIGHPVSHGCVRMTGLHVTELFDLIAEGDPVVII